MKSSLLAILLLLLIPFPAMPAKKLDTGTRKPTVACPMAYWRSDSIVNVHFVRDTFTPEQRQALLDAMVYSEETARKMGLAVTFNYAGETDGLIDCQSCLTVTRQDTYQNHRRGPVTLNALRRNNSGQLISAWIGIDRTRNTSVGLSGLVLEALRGVRGTKALSICKK
ncbi:MAG: hypothetical protein H7Z16_19000 [Pyrinomonadaceae bacterium]|nr:hypothetical protein [Pyrinomonadaceae bacterium]